METKEIILRYNPLGIYVSKDGKCFKGNIENLSSCGIQINLTEISPSESDSGYNLILEKDLPNFNSFVNRPEEILINGQKVRGQYVHKIVAFTFGDCKERTRTKERCVIDHLNMNTLDNRVDNLEYVSYGINLYRAYHKASEGAAKLACQKRLDNYIDSLNEIDKKTFFMDIAADRRGEY